MNVDPRDPTSLKKASDSELNRLLGHRYISNDELRNVLRELHSRGSIEFPEEMTAEQYDEFVREMVEKIKRLEGGK